MQHEKSIERKSMRYAVVAGLFLMVAMLIFECFALKKIDYGKPAIFLIISACGYLYEGNKLHNKKKVVAGIVELLFTFMFLILYIWGLF